jgi:phosphoglucomutase
MQSVLDTLALPQGSRLVLGGDGRFHNDVAIQTIIRMTAAAGVHHLIIGRDGLLSTPAASNLIRTRKADGGFLLTASHNPGGPGGDFGIKFNVASGGQAPPTVTDAVYAASRRLTGYRIAGLPTVDLSRVGTLTLGSLRIEIVDPVDDYLLLMQQLFDFDLMAEWIHGGRQVLFDALHGITGPYAQRILCETLGAPATSLLHARPLPDFGGLHPDPNPVECRHLVERCRQPDPPDLAAASDGDGDRNMILGPGFCLSPGDSVAMLLASAGHVPGYRRGIAGVARSMPTSRALDAVAADVGIPCFETPTGWRYFCNLLEAGRIGLCGEESFGTGSSHAREKDGLWAVLFWLNLLAARKASLPALAAEHWRRFGRHYYQRHDYDIADAGRAEELMSALRGRTGSLTGQQLGDASVELADDFCYRDPVDQSEAAHQGIRVVLDDGCRIVYRLSGTGTTGATLRVYLEKHERDPARLGLDPSTVLASLGNVAAELGHIRAITGLVAPSMVV